MIAHSTINCKENLKMDHTLDNDNNNMKPSKLRPRPAPDHTVLRPSISISVTGMKQAIQALENGSQEIRNYLFYECNIIYECKTCLSLFRSLCNFIAHKRSYCTSVVENVNHVFSHVHTTPRCKQSQSSASIYRDSKPKEGATAFIEPEPIDTIVPEREWDLRDYSPSLALLKEAGFLDEIKSSPLVNKLNQHPVVRRKHRLDSIVKALKSRQDYYPQNALILEPIRQTKAAVFQTISPSESENEIEFKTMGEKYLEYQKLSNSRSGRVFVGPDGKIIPQQSLLRHSYSPDCLKENSTSRIIRRYPCPLCGKLFLNLNTCCGHLQKCHGKSNLEAQRLSQNIKKNSFLSRNVNKKSKDVDKDRKCRSCHKVFSKRIKKNVHESQCLSENEKTITEILTNPPILKLKRWKFEENGDKKCKLPTSSSIFERKLRVNVTKLPLFLHSTNISPA